MQIVIISRISCSYPNNVECEWTIQASEGNLMSITIEMMDIFSSPDCNNDYLELRENDGSGKVLGNIALVTIVFICISFIIIFR